MTKKPWTFESIPIQRRADIPKEVAQTLEEAVNQGPAATRDYLSQKFTVAELKHAYASEALGELWSCITGEERK